jgi:hypothetical protein
MKDKIKDDKIKTYVIHENLDFKVIDKVTEVYKIKAVIKENQIPKLSEIKTNNYVVGLTIQIKKITAEDFPDIQSFVNLKELNIIGKLECKHYVAFENLQNLESISLSGTDFIQVGILNEDGDDLFCQFLDNISKLKKLKILDISNNYLFFHMKQLDFFKRKISKKLFDDEKAIIYNNNLKNNYEKYVSKLDIIFLNGFYINLQNTSKIIYDQDYESGYPFLKFLAESKNEGNITFDLKNNEINSYDAAHFICNIGNKKNTYYFSCDTHEIKSEIVSIFLNDVSINKN